MHPTREVGREPHQNHSSRAGDCKRSALEERASVDSRVQPITPNDIRRMIAEDGRGGQLDPASLAVQSVGMLIGALCSSRASNLYAPQS